MKMKTHYEFVTDPGTPREVVWFGDCHRWAAEMLRSPQVRRAMAEGTTVYRTRKVAIVTRKKDYCGGCVEGHRGVGTPKRLLALAS